MKTNLFKERKCLEMHYQHLEHRKKSIESLTPIHHKMIKENIILINETNKLRKRVTLNQTKYNELLCLLGWQNIEEFSLKRKPATEKTIVTRVINLIRL